MTFGPLIFQFNSGLCAQYGEEIQYMVLGRTKKICEHVINVNENIAQRTAGCEECEKEGTDWVALRLCLSCGHVGCCDSSIGRHATKHYKETGHPVMVALPNKPWKWCYVHEIYA